MRTAESITPKHPDKVCDRISDTILEECLRQDKSSRVAIETMGGHGAIIVTGEITTKADLDIYALVRKVIPNWNGIITQNISIQSPEIAKGVDIGGAGDQGVMVGYACNENEEMIPQEFYLARSLCKFIYEKYQEDGKTQITINNNKEIVDIVVSFNNATTKDLNDLVLSWLTTQSHLDNVKIHINPAGDWSIGSFDADTGLTGRKIVCDAYGSNVPVGGGAFSGKDPSKVDRSAAYAARNIAKKFVKDLDLDYCLVKIAYSIGLDYPLMVEIEGKDKDGKVIDNDILEEFSKSLQPKAIVERFHLLEIPYSEVAEWGSFGNGFEWDL